MVENPRSNVQDLAHDAETGVSHVRFDRDGHDSLATTIVAAVAAVDDVSVLDLEETLADSVDTDALEALLEPPSGPAGSGVGSVRFTFAGHRIDVRRSGEIEIGPSHEGRRQVAAEADG